MSRRQAKRNDTAVVPLRETVSCGIDIRCIIHVEREMYVLMMFTE